MKVSVSVEINKPIEEVWNAIVDFENCSNYISSILSLEVLNKPEDTLVGFKWKETREMFGKESTETMWITDCVENDFYQTRAESHGSIYKSKFNVKDLGDATKLSMYFVAEAQTTSAKIISFLMSFMIKGSMKKEMLKDLIEIKDFLENKN